MGRVQSSRLTYPEVIARASRIYQGSEYGDGESRCLGGDLHECPVHSSGRTDDDDSPQLL